MKSKFIWLFIFIMLSGCSKTLDKLKRLPSSEKSGDVDLNLIKSPLKTSDTLSIINLNLSSLTYGSWMSYYLNMNSSGVIKGSVNKTPFTKFLLHNLSLSDLYLTHGIKKIENHYASNEKFLWLHTPIEKDTFIKNLEPYELPLQKQVYKVMEDLFPLLEEQEFKRFDYSLFTKKNGALVLTPSYRSIIIKNQIERQAKRWKEILAENEGPSLNLTDRINTYKKAYIPTSIFLELNIDKKNGSYQNIRLGMPPLSRTESKNGDKTDFKLFPGFTETLKEPLDGPLMTMEKIHYLYDPIKQKYLDNFSNKAIFIDLHKDFKNPDQLNTTISFGSLKPDAEFLEDLTTTPQFLKSILAQDPPNSAKLLPLEIRDREASIVIEGHMNLKALKSNKLNDFLKKIRVFNFVHKIGLNLKRDEATNNYYEAFKNMPSYKISYSPKNSYVSVRMIKGATKKTEVSMLTMLGFTCIKNDLLTEEYFLPKEKDYEFTCVNDGANYKSFKEKFLNKSGFKMMRKIIGFSTRIQIADALKNIEKINPEEIIYDPLFQKLLGIFNSQTDLIENIRSIQNR